MSSWDVKMNDGWSHTQPCSCSKCRPEPSPVSREKRLTWKQKMIRMNYKMREEASVVIQKNFRMMVEVRKYRLPSWSNNVGQGDRNVVELSAEPIYSGTMIEWKEQLGYAERYCVQGTIHLSNNKISGYLDKFM